MSSLFFTHAVFDSTVHNFVKTVSNHKWSGLIPAPGLADAHHCLPYHIVVKRDKKFFWSRVNLFPTSFKLSDILSDNDVDNNKEAFSDGDTTSVELVSFNRSLDFEIKGKLGATLANEVLDVELEGAEHLTMSANLGKIVEQSVDVPKLVEKIGERKLNVDNDFVREVMSNKRNTLCVVVTSLKLDQGTELKSVVSYEGTSNLEISPITDNSADVGSELRNDKKRSLQIPPGTPIAFRMLEILVKSDRTIQLMVLPDSEGGFEKRKELTPKGVPTDKDPTPGPDPTPEPASVPKELPIRLPDGKQLDLKEIRQEVHPLLSLPAGELAPLRSCFLQLLKRKITLKSISILFQEALNLVTVGEGGKQTTEAELDQLLRCGESGDQGKTLLQTAGFSFEDGRVVYPSTDENNLLSCTSSLLELLAEMNEAQSRMMQDSSDEEKTSLMKMLEDSLVADRLSLDQPSVSGLFSASRRAESLVFSLGFQLERKETDWFLTRDVRKLDEHRITPEDMLVVMCALWDDK